MKEINIIEFLDELELATDKKAVLDKIIVDKYIPFIAKKEVIDVIIANFLDVENGMYTYEPMNKHLSFVLGFVSLYTNLSYDEGEGIIAFDGLMKHNIIDHIISCVGYDYNDFVNMFEETLAAKIDLNNSISTRLASLLGALETILKNMDQEKINELLDQIKQG